jgi:CheY-like chemotaxis protein
VLHSHSLSEVIGTCATISAARILSVSNDPTLALARQLVLESRGFDVETFDSQAVLAACQGKSFDVALVGHTVSRNEKRMLVGELKRLFPGIKVIDLLAYADASDPASDGNCQVHDGPEALLGVISFILSSTQDTAPRP